MDEIADQRRARLEVTAEPDGNGLAARLGGELDVAGVSDVQPDLDRLLRWTAPDMPTRSFPAYAVSVPTARGFVTELLDGWPGEVQETAALLVSELATNAVRHGSGQDFDVSVRFGPGEGALGVGVTDNGPGSPIARKPPVTDEHGRGLQLVGLLATRWGVRRARGSNTKTLWFELTGEQAHPEQDAPRPASPATG